LGKENYEIEDILTDKVDEWGIRYGFFETIQIIIDIASSLVSDNNLGMPKNYAESITILISAGYLEKELGKKIIKMVGLRNMLVHAGVPKRTLACRHEYGIIDVVKLFEYLNYLDDIKKFVNAIKDKIST